jgi:Arc/MetJ family transcription regulator
MEDAMRTTVTLDENLVRELLKISGAKTKTAAVALAVKGQIRRAKLKKLAGLLGTVDVDDKAIQESNRADMKRAQWLEDIGKEKEA